MSGWSLIRLYTIAVYLFMFLPVAVVVLLSFNSSQFGAFPMEGLSLRWFIELWNNDAIVRAFRVSLLLGALTAVISTVLGILAALALVRYNFRGKNTISTLLIAPILIPEVVLAVALLLFLRWLSLPRSFFLLLLGHVVFTLPFVLLVVQARLVSIKREYEEAALSLGAGPIQTFFSITLPLLMPAVFAGMVFAFTISFDDITGTMFWKPGGVETVPTQIFAMLRNSISPEINALGTVMIVMTVAVPVAGMGVARWMAARRQQQEYARGSRETTGMRTNGSISMDNTRRYARLLDRYRHGDVSRRNFLGLIGASAAAYGVMGSPFTKFAHAATPDQVRFDGWGGIVSEAFREHAFNPYTEKTGITVVDGTFGGADEYLARVRASQPGEFNLAHLSGVFDYSRYHSLELTSELNEDNIPNLQNVIPALQQVFRDITNGKLSAVPYDYGTTSIAYNRKFISDDEVKEKGAKVMIDPAHKGKIGGWSDWKTRIWYGALQTGQDPNNIEDMEAVWDAIRTNRDLVLKYWASGAELMSLLAEEEIHVTEGWSGRIKALQDQGHDIGYFDPPGGLGWQECIFVIKGSPMEACEELLNFMLEPEVAIAVAEGQNYPSSLDPQKVEMTDKVKALPAFDPSGTLEGLNFFNADYWNSNEEEWAKQYSRVERGY